MFDNKAFKKFISILICPRCKTDLQILDSGVYCPRCKTAYPSYNGILSFLTNQKKYWHDFYNDKAKNASTSEQAVGYASKKSFNLVYRNTKKLLKNTAGARILDVGCGNGLMTKWLCEKNTVIGVDFVMNMLREAGKNYIIPLHALAINLPFKKSIFDLIIAIGIIQYVEISGEDFVKYLCQFLNQKGEILIVGLNSQSIFRKINRKIKKLLNSDYSKKPENETFDPIKLANLLKNLNFEVSISYTCFPISKSIQGKNDIFKKHIFGSTFFILGRKL